MKIICCLILMVVVGLSMAKAEDISSYLSKSTNLNMASDFNWGGMAGILNKDEITCWHRVISDSNAIHAIGRLVAKEENPTNINCFLDLLYKIGSLESEAALIRVSDKLLNDETMDDNVLICMLGRHASLGFQSWQYLSGLNADMFTNRINKYTNQVEKSFILHLYDVEHDKSNALFRAQCHFDVMRILLAEYSNKKDDCIYQIINILSKKTPSGGTYDGINSGQNLFILNLKDMVIKFVSYDGELKIGRICIALNNQDPEIRKAYLGYTLTPSEYAELIKYTPKPNSPSPSPSTNQLDKVDKLDKP